MHPAVQQRVILDVSNGNTVTEQEFEWAVEHGYVDVQGDGSVEVTEKGWRLLNDHA